MAECNRAAVGVKLLVYVDAKLLADCYGLCRKRLVCLNDIEIFNLVAGLLHNLLCSRNRTDTHNLRSAACKCARYEGSHRRYAKFFRLLLAHHNDSSCTVVDAGSVSCRHEAVGIDRTEFLQALDGRSRSRSLVNLELNHLFFLLHHNGNDLFVECAALLRRLSLRLALECKLIQLLAGKAPLSADIVRSHNHMVIIESIPQRIVHHSVNQRAVVHSVTVTSLHNRIRSHRHILHTACNNDVSVARLNHLCSHVHTV